MEPSIAELSSELLRKNIRPSHQRIKVLEYLTRNQTHPTVDQIFNDVLPDCPTLSKTTVYNTLDVFEKAGLVRKLSIENSETRYDIVVEEHGHFKCDRCGRIYNFQIDLDRFAVDGLKDFTIVDKDVYFRGICPQCRKAE